MTDAMFVLTMPEDPQVYLRCEKCTSTSFNVKVSMHDGEIQAFHTVCVLCGKRGLLQTTVHHAVKRSFVQYADYPPIVRQSVVQFADCPPSTLTVSGGPETPK